MAHVHHRRPRQQGLCHVNAGLCPPAFGEPSPRVKKARPKAAKGAVIRTPLPITKPAGPAAKSMSATAPRLRHGSWRLGAIGVASLMAAGCAGLPQAPTAGTAPVAALQFKPVLRLDGVNVSAEQSYAAGKKALEEGRLYLALLQFDQAASLRPDWVDPVNARIVTLARLGRIDEALDAAERAAARGLDSAEMRHNVALLATRSGTASVASAGAKSTQPAAPRESTPKADARQAPQEQMAAAAAATTATKSATHAVPMPAAPVDRPRAPADTPSAPTPSNMPIVVGATAPTLEGPRWVYRTPHVLELKMDNPPAFAAAPSPSLPAIAAPSIAAPAVAVATAANDASAPKLRLSMMGVEVSNGAGASGLAKATSRQLRTAGIQPWRITNYNHFNVAQTEVQYRKAGDASAARLLARQMGVSVAMVQNPDLHPSISLRVVLGKDVATLPQNRRILAEGPSQLELFKG